ncbi:hypothetical protein GCM10009596_07900 [Arthrobacter rhombi]
MAGAYRAYAVDMPTLHESQPQHTEVNAVSEQLRRETGARQGLDFLRAIISGELPESPLLTALGVHTVHADAGTVRLETVPQSQQFNTIGTGHGGFLSTLLDTALGFSVESLSPAGTTWTTTDLHVRFRRPMTVDSGVVSAVGHVEHYGRSTAIASGEVRDGEGRILASATASFFALRDQE